MVLVMYCPSKVLNNLLNIVFFTLTILFNYFHLADAMQAPMTLAA